LLIQVSRREANGKTQRKTVALPLLVPVFCARAQFASTDVHEQRIMMNQFGEKREARPVANERFITTRHSAL
jgi:hypothetical protein